MKGENNYDYKTAYRRINGKSGRQIHALLRSIQTRQGAQYNPELPANAKPISYAAEEFDDGILAVSKKL